MAMGCDYRCRDGVLVCEVRASDADERAVLPRRLHIGARAHDALSQFRGLLFDLVRFLVLARQFCAMFD